ncbi:hypothetical protein [Roseospirillum parvum]|uniref:Protease inhibitor Inh n=1 Tax=Roseospirillum parvum TaxID=83401 RepID=A0A1G7V0K7_9PROT|nr:hypothetical protein [Roseospirillum parvum]SDG53287.1 hypothetical protein SAMN05421742_101498 [Roseospirillum parvum]
MSWSRPLVLSALLTALALGPAAAQTDPAAPPADENAPSLGEVITGSWGFIGKEPPEDLNQTFKLGAQACIKTFAEQTTRGDALAAGMQPMPEPITNGQLAIYNLAGEPHMVWASGDLLVGQKFEQAVASEQNGQVVLLLQRGGKPRVGLLPRLLPRNGQPHPVMKLELNRIIGPSEGWYVRCQ